MFTITSPKAWELLVMPVLHLLMPWDARSSHWKRIANVQLFVGPIVPGTSVQMDLSFLVHHSNWTLPKRVWSFFDDSLPWSQWCFPGSRMGTPFGFVGPSFKNRSIILIAYKRADNLGAILSACWLLSRLFKSNPEIAPQGPPMNMKTVYHAMIKAYEIQGCYQMRNAF